MFWRRKEKREPDAIADIRNALGQFIKRYLRDCPAKDVIWSLEVRRCAINGVPVGDWRFTVEPLPAQGIEAATAGETQSGSTEGESPVRQDAPELPPEMTNER